MDRHPKRCDVVYRIPGVDPASVATLLSLLSWDSAKDIASVALGSDYDENQRDLALQLDAAVDQFGRAAVMNLNGHIWTP